MMNLLLFLSLYIDFVMTNLFINKKNLFPSIKHDLIIGKDMSETRRQKNLIKTLD